jgi:tetratricopeptide (TPR) repeat protein
VAAISKYLILGVTICTIVLGTVYARAQPSGNDAQISKLRQAVKSLAVTAAPPVAVVTPPNIKVAEAVAETLAVDIQATSAGVSIKYPWTRPVAVATFIRNDVLWVIFNRAIIANHAPIDPRLKLRLQSAKQASHAQATVLQYKVTPGQWAGILQEGNIWTVVIKDTEILPRTILSTQVVDNSVAGGGVSIPVKMPGNIVTVIDPTLGDAIFVAPVQGMAQGFSKTVKLRGGELLSTTQGVAFVPLSRRYALIRQDESVLVTDSATSASSSPASTFVRSAVGTATTRLIDFENWAVNDGRRFEDIESDLLYQLSVLARPAQQKMRWQIATLYLARGLPQRALGVMAAMVRKEKQLEYLPQFRAARGVASFMSHNYTAAREDLLDISLDGVSEVWLWRARLHDVEMRPQDTVESFARGSDVISQYGYVQRADFQLSAIRSAIAIGNGSMAQRELSLLPMAELLPAQRSEAYYWKGRLAALQGHMPEALKIYRSIGTDTDRRAHAMAQLSATQILVDNGSQKLSSAIHILERLRYAWRGDSLELELLDTLAKYYSRSRRFREALVAYRQSISYFTPNDHTRNATVMQDKLFRSLFLDGVADTITPVQSLALFTDFQGLAPLGTDGDMMIRRLSERLVDVGLYHRAAELLEHQVRMRLEGTAQAVVALRLAMVQILAEKPQAALDAIRFTRAIAIDDNILASRNRIEARALIDLGDYDAADVLLGNDSSAIAQILRADLAWTSKSWSQLASITSNILENTDQSTVNAADRVRHIMRLTFAQNMLNNLPALQALKKRYATLLAGGRYEQAFSLLSSGATLSPADIRSLSITLVSIDRLDSFKKIYRAELRSMDIPLTTTASLTPEQAAALTPAAGTAGR